MPAEDTVTRPWQKTIDFVDELKGKLPDEELAVIKRYVEKTESRGSTVAGHCYASGYRTALL